MKLYEKVIKQYAEQMKSSDDYNRKKIEYFTRAVKELAEKGTTELVMLKLEKIRKGSNETDYVNKVKAFLNGEVE